MDNPEYLEKLIETDVLVIGGGIAGVFAAVKAREQGVDVTLVSKGTIGRSGQSPWAHCTMVVSPDWEDKHEELMAQTCISGEYVNNREWTERVIKESYARFQDLLSWGQPFIKDENGNYMKVIKEDREVPGRLMLLTDGPGSWVQSLKNQPEKTGVHILERIMIVDLIKQGGIIVGAIGISTDSWNLYVFKAKSTIICTGAGGFKPVGGWPIGDLTADGHVMAYKAGAEITGKEFEDPHSGLTRREGSMWLSLDPPTMIDAEGNELDMRVEGFGIGLDFDAHLGRAPIFRGNYEVFSSVALGMSVHTAEGIWLADEDCSVGIPGLYAAGDACGTMINGAQYNMGGSATAIASVTGTRAGTAAAEYAKQTKKLTIDEQTLASIEDLVLMPAKRRGGFSPGWVMQLLRDTMMPYFVLRVKHGERLQAILTMIEFIRDHLSPQLFARDPHELRLAHETKNMIVNAEMRLRASLFRTESRGMHYREDYPHRQDPDWLAWVLLKEENCRMIAIKKPIPREWWPDLSTPYEERYPTRFPGE